MNWPGCRTISNGSCIIEMPEEIVDISVDTQMDNIRELLENIKV